jgi:aerobic-type carbon monoxide dehydrogenase small subunit (CoxS/CutS family)
MTSAVFSFTVNGTARQCEVDKDKPLLWVLRENFGLTGTKYGCGIAMCGACTVLIEDKKADGSHVMNPVRACVVPAEDVQNRRITTIEGLSNNNEHPVQQAWIKADVPQCGYCQSGQIMTTVGLLDAVRREGRELNDNDIDGALAGNLCRCGTYPRIREAVKAAWQEVKTAERGK